MDFKNMLAALDRVENAEGTSESSVAQKGSMKALLESLDSVAADEEVEAVTESEKTFVGINTKSGDFESGLSYKEVTSGRFTHMMSDDETYFDPDTAEELVGASDDDMESMGWEIVMPSEETDYAKTFKTPYGNVDANWDSNAGEFGDFDAEDKQLRDIMMNMADDFGSVDHDNVKAFIQAAMKKRKGMNEAEEYVDPGEETDYAAEVNEELEEAIMVSAEGDEAAELLAILQNAGMAAPAMPAMPEPEMEDTEYSNSPDEETFGMDAVIASGDDLNKSKEAYADVDGGDNPMETFEGKFKAMLDEMLAEDEETTEEVVAEETEEVVAEETDEVVEADDLGLSRFLKMAGV
jgi:hypothetical protein